MSEAKCGEPGAGVAPDFADAHPGYENWRRSLRLPWDRPALDLLEHHRRDQPKEPDGHDADEHDVDLQELPRIPDQVADAALGGDELRRHQHDEGNRERDAKP